MCGKTLWHRSRRLFPLERNALPREPLFLPQRDFHLLTICVIVSFLLKGSDFKISLLVIFYLIKICLVDHFRFESKSISLLVSCFPGCLSEWKRRMPSRQALHTKMDYLCEILAVLSPAPPGFYFGRVESKVRRMVSEVMTRTQGTLDWWFGWICNPGCGGQVGIQFLASKPVIQATNQREAELSLSSHSSNMGTLPHVYRVGQVWLLSRAETRAGNKCQRRMFTTILPFNQ